MNLLIDNQPTTASEIIKDNDLTQEEVNMIKGLKHGDFVYIGICKIERPAKITQRKVNGKVIFYRNGQQIEPVSYRHMIAIFDCGTKKMVI